MRIMLALFVSIALVSFAVADTIHVWPGGGGDQPTIAAAVAVAEPGDLILLAPGYFTGDGNRDVVVDKDVTIRGDTAAPGYYVIDCGGSSTMEHRAFDVDGSADVTLNPVIEGLTVIYGYAARGGAIRLQECSVTVNDCRFLHNRAERGGAVGLTTPSGIATFNRCWFQHNVADDQGAAGFAVNISSLVLNWCTIYDNDGGGAFGLQLGGITCYNCTIVDNEGGAIVGYDLGWGGVRTENCIIAWNGGPAFADDPDLTAYVECTDIYGNSGGNWNTAPVLGLLGVDGNIDDSPMFCGWQGGDLELDADSPCAAYSPPNEECALIGAWPVGCGTVATRAESWSGVKEMFR